MKNFVSGSKYLTFPITSIVAPNSPPKSGDPCVVGRLVGVASTTGVSGGSVALQCEGVFTVSVQSVHNGVSVGESVFIDPSTAVVSDDLNDVPFGVALDAVSAGATTAVRVRLFGATPGAVGAGS